MRIVFSVLILSCAVFADQVPEGRSAFIAASVKYHQGLYDDSLAGYQQTIALHLEVPYSKHMIARLWGLEGDIDKAMAALDDAAEFEFPGVQILQTDPEFATERQDPRYPAILAKVISNNQQHACTSRPGRRVFDFWVGVWDVTANGKHLGVDRIDLAEGTCALKESWTGDAPGDIGESTTFYDRLTAYWHQVWIDPSGQGQDFYGGLADGAMAFSRITYNGGLMTIYVSSYAPMPDGTVQQTSQQSTDNGNTWSTPAILTYTRQAQ